jgi:hypothetical protein
MANPAIKPATYQDILALPPNLVGEIVYGRLITHLRPAPRHARASSNLGVRIGGPFDLGDGGPGGWWILDEPELHLGGHVLVPNLAGWRRERVSRLPDTAGLNACRTGFLKCCHRLRPATIVPKSCRSTAPWARLMPGWSIRTRGFSRLTKTSRGAGCWYRPMPATAGFPFRLSKPSNGRWGNCGRSNCRSK